MMTTPTRATHAVDPAPRPPCVVPAGQGEAGWSRPPRRPRLTRGQVHVWRSPLDLGSGELARRARLLSPDEMIRAGRFLRVSDRDRFVAARGFLRSVLGVYLHAAPAAVRFGYSRRGKPTLAAAGAGEPLGFNLSHSGDWAVCAVAPSRFVGVDVERVRGDLPVDELVDVFSPAERGAFATLAPADRVRGFFAAWTRKEALAKALGAGLAAPLDRIEVPLGPGATGLVRTPAWPVGSWWHADLSPAPGYAGSVAVAAEGEGWRALYWDGPPDGGVA